MNRKEIVLPAPGSPRITRRCERASMPDTRSWMRRSPRPAFRFVHLRHALTFPPVLLHVADLQEAQLLVDVGQRQADVLLELVHPAKVVLGQLTTSWSR